jgi:hypothetical protein
MTKAFEEEIQDMYWDFMELYHIDECEGLDSLEHYWQEGHRFEEFSTLVDVSPKVLIRMNKK